MCPPRSNNRFGKSYPRIDNSDNELTTRPKFIGFRQSDPVPLATA